MILQVVISCLAAVVLAHPGHGPDVYNFHSYHGPLAPLAHDGRVVDTPEVAHAKAAHFKAYHDELSKAPQYGPEVQGYHHEAGPIESVGGHDYHEPQHAYHGPPAPLAKDGRVVDTPEVAHAKAAHFHAFAEELSKISHYPEHKEETHHGGFLHF